MCCFMKLLFNMFFYRTSNLRIDHLSTKTICSKVPLNDNNCYSKKQFFIMKQFDFHFTNYYWTF